MTYLLPKSQFEQLEMFKREAEKNRLVMIDFWADWCGACKAMKPEIEHLSYSFPDTLIVFTVDTGDDSYEMLVNELSVSSLPTTVLFRNGTVLDVRHTPMTYDALVKWVGDFL